MLKETLFIVLIVFGSMLLTGPVLAQEVEGVYCKFDLKEAKGWKRFLKAAKCEVEVDTELGSFEYQQPLYVDRQDLNWRNWFKDDDE